MATRMPVTVFKCPCGVYLVTPDGLDNHLNTCPLLINQVSSVVDVKEEDEETPLISVPNSSKPDNVVGNVFGVEIIEFRPCKVVLDDIAPVKEEDFKSETSSSVSVSQRGRLSKAPLLFSEEAWKKDDDDELSSSDFDTRFDHDDETDDEEEFNARAPKKRKRQPGPASKTMARSFTSFRQPSKNVADDQYTFKCDLCPVKYNKEEKFQWHMEYIHGSSSKEFQIFTCPICGRMFNRRIHIQSHIRYHVNAEALEEAFSLWDSWPNRKPRSNKFQFPCKFCMISHSNQHSFLTHMKNQHPEKSRHSPIPCPHCDSTKVPPFPSMKLFVVHLRQNHHQEYYGKTKSFTLSEGKMYVNCPVCRKRYRCYYLQEHLEKMHPVRSDQLLPDEADEKRFLCPVPDCFAAVKTRIQLKTHFVLHLDNNPYVCPVPSCGKKCDAQCHLERHIRQHTGADLLQCPKCKVCYSRQDKLDRHKCIFDPKRLKKDRNGFLRSRYSQVYTQRVPHEGILNGNPNNPFDPTKKRRYGHFNINHVIKTDPVYLRIVKDKPEFEKVLFGKDPGGGGGFSKPNEVVAKKTYVCDECATRFFDKKALEKHATVCKVLKKEPGSTENGGGEKLGCPICGGGSFEDYQGVVSHVKDEHPHEVFKCDDCERMYSARHVLERHLALHRRKYPCMSCHKRFVTEEERIEHKKGCEKRKECSKCGKVLVNLASWKRHWKLIHGVAIQDEDGETGSEGRKAKLTPKKKKKKAVVKKKKKKVTMASKSYEESEAVVKMEPVATEPVCIVAPGEDIDLGLEDPVDNIIKSEHDGGLVTKDEKILTEEEEEEFILS